MVGIQQACANKPNANEKVGAVLLGVKTHQRQDTHKHSNGPGNKFRQHVQIG